LSEQSQALSFIATSNTLFFLYRQGSMFSGYSICVLYILRKQAGGAQSIKLHMSQEGKESSKHNIGHIRS
jgi:hypothetical protein